MTETKLDDQMVGESSAEEESGPTIFVVEPSGVLGKVVAHVCECRGVTVRLSKEVGAALDEVSTHKPTAILTALELTGLSGTSLIAALKVCPRHRGIPVGLMTSSDSLDRFREAHEPDVIIHKGSEFADEIEGFLKTYGIGVDEESDPNLEPRRLSGRILVAENNHGVQNRFSTLLHVAGADVVCVENGNEAMTAATEDWFDLILMDVELPELNGRDAAGRIRALGVTTPMIATTVGDRDTLLIDAENLGFDDVLAKPMDRLALIESCRSYMNGETP